MKSEKLDLEFLLRSKKNPEDSEQQDEFENAQDGASPDEKSGILRNSNEDSDTVNDEKSESELLSYEKTSEFEISDDAVDLMWVLERKEKKAHDKPKAEPKPDSEPDKDFTSENSEETNFIKIEDSDESAGLEEQKENTETENDTPEMEWEPLILPEEPRVALDDEQAIDLKIADEGHNENLLKPSEEEPELDFALPEEGVDNDLKLIIEQIERHEKSEKEHEKPEGKERREAELGMEDQFNEDTLSFDFEDEALSENTKQEINELIEVIHPESTDEEDSDASFSLEPESEGKTVKDMSSLLMESKKNATSIQNDDIDSGLNLMSASKEKTPVEKETVRGHVENKSQTGAPQARESAFTGFLKEQQQGGDKKTPVKKTHKKGKPQPRLKKSSQFSLTDLFESQGLLGLDMGAHSIKYVHLKKSGRSLRFVNLKLATNPYIDPEHSKEEKNQIISRHLSKNFNIKDFKNAVIGTAISGMEVVFKNVQVPHMAKKELTKAVPWACRKDFPFPLESTVFDFKNITDADKKTGKWDMFVIAGQKDLISNHLSLLNESRIVPAKISTIPEALWRAFQLGELKDSPQCHILMDIGKNSSHMVFINKGRLEFAREISTASSDFTDALAGVFFVDGNEIEISPEEAEKIKQQHGLPGFDSDAITEQGVPLQEFSVMMGPVLERLISNVQRTIEFYKEKFQVRDIEDLHLTGGGSLMTNLPEKFSEELGLNVKLFNPFNYISLKKADNADSLRNKGPLFAVPVGLAIGKVNELNLLPPELKGSYTIEYLKRMYKYVFIIFLLAMAFLSQNVARKISEIESEFHRLNKEFRSSEPMRKKYLALQQMHQNLLAVKGRYGNSLESDIHAVNYLKAISLAIPPKITLTSLRIFYRKIKNEDSLGGAKNRKNKKNKADEEVQYTEKEFVVLDGIAFESNSMEGMNLARFLMQLEKLDFFRTISLTSQKVREDGSLQFTIECEPYEAE